MAEDDEDDDNLAGEMPELDDLAVEGDDRAAPRLDPAVVRRFLPRQKALDMAAAAVRPIVPAREEEDLATDAVVRALKARPPCSEKALSSWLWVIARRVAARWLEKRARRAEHEGQMPVPKEVSDDYTGHASRPTPRRNAASSIRTWGKRPRIPLEPYLESIIAPHDCPILDVIRERAAGGKTYADLAAERKMSVDQLDRKIRRFKTKYAPRVRRRRTVLLLLKLGAALVVAVAAVLYFLLARRPPPSDEDPFPIPRQGRCCRPARRPRRRSSLPRS